MKYVFEKSDIKMGSCVKRANRYYMITWSNEQGEGILGESDRIIYLTCLYSDGMSFAIGTKWEEILKVLNKDYGYSPVVIPQPTKEN